MANATNPQLERAGSHSLTLRGDKVEKEEVYFYFKVTWLGKETDFTMQARRDLHSEGMSDWRIYPYYTYGVNLSDTARRKCTDVCVPIVQQWLRSPEYLSSRANAFWHQLRSLLVDMSKHSLDSTLVMIDRFRAEISPDQYGKLRQAAEYKRLYYEVLGA